MVQIIYDGECPFCSRFVKLTRLQKRFGDVQLINARDKIALAKVPPEFLNVSLDDGMLVIHEGVSYYGDEAVHILSVMASRSGAFSRLFLPLFRNRGMSRLIYPILKFGRRVTLKVLGIKPLEK